MGDSVDMTDQALPFTVTFSTADPRVKGVSLESVLEADQLQVCLDGVALVCGPVVRIEEDRDRQIVTLRIGPDIGWVEGPTRRFGSDPEVEE